MHPHPVMGRARPRPELDRLIREHGLARVAVAAVIAAAAHLARPRPPAAEPLHPHLRRDIGLPPLPPGRDHLRHL